MGRGVYETPAEPQTLPFGLTPRTLRPSQEEVQGRGSTVAPRKQVVTGNLFPPSASFCRPGKRPLPLPAPGEGSQRRRLSTRGLSALQKAKMAPEKRREKPPLQPLRPSYQRKVRADLWSGGSGRGTQTTTRGPSRPLFEDFLATTMAERGLFSLLAPCLAL